MRTARFCGEQLYAAVDSRRQELGLSWAAVARQIGVALSTLKRTQQNGPMETDGILSMTRWLGRPPEDFVVGALPNENPVIPKGRFNTKKLYEALDGYRSDKGMSWRELADDIGCASPAMLTHLAKGGRVEFGLMIAALTKLRRPISSFTQP